MGGQPFDDAPVVLTQFNAVQRLQQSGDAVGVATSVEEAALFRVKPGTTAQDITTYFQNAFGGTGKPASVPFLAGPHGIPGTATGHTATLELSVPPGQYALVSFAVDPSDGRRAVSEGMFQLVTLR